MFFLPGRRVCIFLRPKESVCERTHQFKVFLDGFLRVFSLGNVTVVEDHTLKIRVRKKVAFARRFQYSPRPILVFVTEFDDPADFVSALSQH